MKKLLGVVAVGMVMLCFGALQAGYASSIGFESFAEDDVVSGPGVFSDLVFSTDAGGYDILAADVVTGVANPLLPDFGGLMAAYSPDYSSFSLYRSDFLIPQVNYVSLVMGDYNVNDGSFISDSDNLFLRAYDNSSNLLGEAAYLLNPSEGNVGHTLFVSAPDIKYVTFGSTGVYPNSIFFDNFQYKVVPEPASMLLMGLGGMVFALFRKKKR